MPKILSSEPATGSAPALRRAVHILDLVSQLTTPPTFTEIVDTLGLPKSSVHGLCATLVELGLLIRSEAGTYRLGPHTMSWANGFLRQTDLVAEFQQLLNERQELSQFTVTLTVLEGMQVIYLACANSNRALGFTFRIGMRLPAPFTATGKAILSALSDQEISQRLSGQWPAPLTPHSVATYNELMTELAEARQRGFSVDNGQIRDGMLCIGAPVYDFSGNVVAGLAVSMLELEATAEAIDQTGHRLVELSKKLSARMGNRP
ncbi:IclR family transcriptional regulator [Citrobacter sp. JGM124]|uniref:IclR family transcriptional regulator n=1 Tax=Citrobacter sp. JGM124 TaxID=2799789 RepID=UPI001BA4B7A1|nr:IclR family transcriptional regulator [Citrobacter sp. JGM124]MBS0847140.1 IclR family transcriptional regulator [Citrobacter sp. JGM124]